MKTGNYGQLFAGPWQIGSTSSRIDGRLVACFFLVAILAFVLRSDSVKADDLVWSNLPQLPDEFGFGGPIAGVHDGVLIVAGGANFPDGPPWQVGDAPPGKKVWHDQIFALTQGAKDWQ